MEFLSSLKKVWVGEGREEERSEGCKGCDPAVLAKCAAAEAGSVGPHAAHVFVKLPAPQGSDPAATDESWWPERLEDESPDIACALAAVKDAGERIHGKVKITAFDYLQPTAQPSGTCDVFVQPEGLLFKQLPLERLGSTVVQALEGATRRQARDAAAPEREQQAAALAGECVAGMAVFVCCHASRDARCGHIGPPLADKLAAVVADKGVDGGIQVLKTSHVGGHVYAGNVLVFSHGKDYHGDWFGGLHANNAAAFLNALLSCKSPSGAPGDFSLRGYWRGRIGMTKEQQLECFKKGLKDIEELALD